MTELLEKPALQQKSARDKKPELPLVSIDNPALIPAKNRKKAAAPLEELEARYVYPFAAIVGQEEMKLSLLLNVVDPHIGGVMIMGHRGTGKSTIVRALADLLPPVKTVKGCLYGCDPDPARRGALCRDCRAKLAEGKRLSGQFTSVPVVDLPLGATEDRVCGTIDIEKALSQGIKAFEPGLLARANRGFLYIDEVNLLEDHLVDVLLDVAAGGVNTVEREGISVRHPARFVLVGSGNPEEGDLRPQLLDRFGLHARIVTILDLHQRVEIVKRRQAFEHSPATFMADWQPEQERLRDQIKKAQRLLPQVQIPQEVLLKIAELCLALGIDGHRGELTIARASTALAALNHHKKVTLDDVRQVSGLALRHRLRKDPLDNTDNSIKIEQAVNKLLTVE
ncbi:MAG TPA: magnesium chelatase ATPase subunit I [Chloroflexia bacterium]|nr:magnesium chelatase ATPase subunit I [Chloroflexia bacterium]